MGLFNNKKHEERISFLENNQKEIIELQRTTGEMLQRISASSVGAGSEVQMQLPGVVPQDIKIEMPANPEIQKIEIVEKEKIIEDQDKYRAAYALNLLTVSVSQIVSYNDLHILDQEYDMILNNLNLEMMPKDEALLSTFKQLLDTITFFKIQDGDKKQLEKQYQQKMRAAIWSATPNFGVIVAGSGGNPYAAAAILATQIGIGYMNYRKEKAKVKAEHEAEQWKLQRSAMEQFNALRRELFDTSWRIADEYDFKDEWRLTEKQIDQYNEILMDTNPIRRCERLYAVRDAFIAYPPFWYYMAKSAKEVADDHRSLADTVYIRYMELAKANYINYIRMVTDESENPKEAIRFTGLLREDQIAASAFLEFVALENNGLTEIGQMEMITKAKKVAGRNYDTLQLCALGFLRLTGSDDVNIKNNAYGEAVATLRYLINEGYNATGNAQLLSTLYVRQYIMNKNDGIRNAYSLLSERIDVRYLFPMPSDENVNYEQLQNEFISMQRTVIAKKYAYVFRSVADKYTIMFNRALPLPSGKKEFKEEMYLDAYDCRQERYNIIKEQFNNKQRMEDYVKLLKGAMVFNKYLDIFNDLYKALRKLEFVDHSDNEILSVFCQSIESYQDDVANNLKALDDNMYSFDKFTSLFNMSFFEFTQSFWNKVCESANIYISGLDSMEQLSMAESNLWEMCIHEGIDEPEVLFELSGNSKHYIIDKTYISSSLLGEQVEAAAEILDRKNKMREIFGRYKEELKVPVVKNNKDTIEVISVEEKRFSKILRDMYGTGTISETAFGIIYESVHKYLGISLIFHADGIAVVKGRDVVSKCIDYSTAEIVKKKADFMLDSYTIKGVDQKKLEEMIEELSKYVPQESSDKLLVMNDAGKDVSMNEKTQICFTAQYGEITVGREK